MSNQQLLDILKQQFFEEFENEFLIYPDIGRTLENLISVEKQEIANISIEFIVKFLQEKKWLKE